MQVERSAPETAFPAGRDKNLLIGRGELELLATAFHGLLPAGAAIESHLRAVIGETLGHPGSLFRAQLVFAAVRGHQPSEVARELAVAIEYFHTASLLFDDLPAMDDARERRGFPCAHVRHGEAAAMLGALALINQGYHLLWRVFAGLPPERSQKAAALVGECLGLRGILDGQARDLHFRSSAGGEKEVLAVAQGKTVTLIRLTLLLPAIVVGAGEEEQGRLEKLAAAWGHAYQIVDDFKDLLMEDAEIGKSARRDHQLGRPNLPVAIGAGPAHERLRVWLAESRRLVAGMPGRPELARLQQVLAGEAVAVAERLASLKERSCA